MIESIDRRSRYAGVALLCLSMLVPKLLAQDSIENKSNEAKSDHYQSFFLSSPPHNNGLNDIVTDLRNMVPMAKIYDVQSKGAISVRGSLEDIQLAKKILADIDRPKPTYRLTYTITETEGGNRINVQHSSITVVSGEKTGLKQGSKVPVVTGYTEGNSQKTSTEYQYVDVGLNIEASLDAGSDALRLRTKIEQTGISEEKTTPGIIDPAIRQSTLETIANVTVGKPIALGSLDVPGSTHHKEIEVLAELVR